MENSILELNTETISLYKRCFDENQIPKQYNIIEWQFFKNNNKNYVSIEFDNSNNKAAAIYATFGVTFKIESQELLGCQSLDTITDIDYRGKGLFVKLAKHVYHNAKNEGIALVYGFPNGNSIHGFKTKLEWDVLDSVPFLIKPLKSSYFTSRISFLNFLPNFKMSFLGYTNSNQYRIEEAFSFPQETNQLWKIFSKDIKVAVQRNKKYLDWRYINKPLENYKIAHCYSKENVYLGFIVYVVKEKHGGKIAYIMELIFNLNNPMAGDKLLQYAVNQIKKEDADCILSWCLPHSPNKKTFKKEFFFNLPEKFRPIELHFGARSFKSELNAIINNRNNWYLSYSDSDTV